MWRQPNNKYNNKKITTEEGVFDSKKEYQRWCELKLLQKLGEIEDLQRQVEFELISAKREAPTVNSRGTVKLGKVIEKKCSYYADFTYKKDGELTVEDVKSEITRKNPEYIIKRKLMLDRHGIRIKEV